MSTGTSSMRQRLLVILLVATLVGVGAQAGEPREAGAGCERFEVTDPCGAEGTWHGVADNGFAWVNTITRGATASCGQVDLMWVGIDPTLGGAFASAARISNGRGVWRKISRQQAQWTWMAFASDAGGALVYIARVVGTHTMPSCDRIDIEYAFEVFLPWQDLAADAPVACLRGTSVETRMRMMHSMCEPAP